MAKLYDALDDRLTAFLSAQKVFFVGTAPLAADGHVNVSPKGLDSFRVLGPRTVGYVDFTGSGCETIAHLRESGRIVLLFCAFEGPPKILRLHGRGRVVERGDAEWAELAPRFPVRDGTRTILVVELTRICDSCGYSVPLMDFRAERRQLDDWVERKGPEGVAGHQRRYSARSIDGLPGMRSPGAG